MSRQWLQIEYFARQIRRHASDLSDALEEIESGVAAARRVTGALPDDGGAA